MMLPHAIHLEPDALGENDLLEDMAETLAVSDLLPCLRIGIGLGESGYPEFHQARSGCVRFRFNQSRTHHRSSSGTPAPVKGLPAPGRSSNSPASIASRISLSGRDSCVAIGGRSSMPERYRPEPMVSSA